MNIDGQRRTAAEGFIARGSADAFTLVEVVVAAGILAGVLVAILGLAAFVERSGGEIADMQTIAGLGEAIEEELERLEAERGFAGMAALTNPGVILVASHKGDFVRCAGGESPAADRPADDPELCGIARRDRYFLIKITQVQGLEYRDGDCALALSARMEWPYLLPAAPIAGGSAGDAAREVPETVRNIAVIHFVLNP